MDSVSTLLSGEHLSVRYGQIVALTDISLQVGPGQAVGVLGANGAGKSTLLKAIAGLVKSSGEVWFEDEPISHEPPDRRVARGIVYVPEGRHVFPFLSVAENLRLGSWSRGLRRTAPRRLDETYELIPLLRERHKQLAGTLSGGQQQLLAIGRAIMADPKILLLDEPSLGLSPIAVRLVFQVIRQIRSAKGMAMLLVEQNVVRALEESSFAYVLANGAHADAGVSGELAGRESIRRAYMGL